MDLVCRVLCMLLPCTPTSGGRDAVWTSGPSVPSIIITQSAASAEHGQVKRRSRKRWASSPKCTPGARIYSPQITPIERLASNISVSTVPSISDIFMPVINYFSRILSNQQISAIFESFSPSIKLQPWTLLFSISKDGCSLQNLYNKLSSFKCTLLLVIQVNIVTNIITIFVTRIYFTFSRIEDM